MNYNDIKSHNPNHPNSFAIIVECNGEKEVHHILGRSQADAEETLAATGWFQNSVRNIIGKPVLSLAASAARIKAGSY